MLRKSDLSNSVFSEIAPVRKPFPERAERHKPNAELFQRRQNLLLRLAPPQRIFALQRRHRLHRMRPPNTLRPRFRHPEILHLALPDEFLHRSSHIFDRHRRVNAMLIQQIDRDRSAASSTPHPHVRESVPACCPILSPESLLESKLRSDHHFVAKRLDRLPNSSSFA